MAPKLVKFDPRANDVRHIQRQLGRSVSRSVNSFGKEIAGFALVVWDEKGSCSSSLCTETGPISAALAPVYVQDAINRHVSLLMVERGTRTRSIDD